MGPEEKENLPGYPHYPASEDIFNKQEEADFDLDDEYEVMEKNLDVPGADLDDDAERIGEEDEENNYYSIGGDDHNDLEEYNP